MKINATTNNNLHLSYRSDIARLYAETHSPERKVKGRGCRTVKVFREWRHAHDFTKGATFARIVPICKDGDLWSWTTDEPIMSIWTDATRKAGTLTGYVVDRYDV